jgi:hypothetical protein
MIYLTTVSETQGLGVVNICTPSTENFSRTGFTIYLISPIPLIYSTHPTPSDLITQYYRARRPYRLYVRLVFVSSRDQEFFQLRKEKKKKRLENEPDHSPPFAAQPSYECMELHLYSFIPFHSVVLNYKRRFYLSFQNFVAKEPAVLPAYSTCSLRHHTT